MPIWLWGVPVLGALVALTILAERTWLAGAAGTAAFAEILRLVIYWYWCRLAWRAALQARPAAAALARVALALGLVTVALT